MYPSIIIYVITGYYYYYYHCYHLYGEIKILNCVVCAVIGDM